MRRQLACLALASTLLTPIMSWAQDVPPPADEATQERVRALAQEFLERMGMEAEAQIAPVPTWSLQTDSDRKDADNLQQDPDTGARIGFAACLARTPPESADQEQEEDDRQRLEGPQLKRIDRHRERHGFTLRLVS